MQAKIDRQRGAIAETAELLMKQNTTAAFARLVQEMGEPQ
jgi:hypothetical protein